MELYIGSKVRLLRQMLNEKVGSIGFVVELYKDFDNSDLCGASIVFQSGSFDGFSAKDQDLFLEHIGEDPRFSTYNFINVLQVQKDFRNKYWDFR
jgi:hypothetical protein